METGAADPSDVEDRDPSPSLTNSADTASKGHRLTAAKRCLSFDGLTHDGLSENDKIPNVANDGAAEMPCRRARVSVRAVSEAPLVRPHYSSLPFFLFLLPEIATSGQTFTGWC